MIYNDIAVGQQVTVRHVCQCVRIYVCMCNVTHLHAVGMCYTSITELLVRTLYTVGYSDASLTIWNACTVN